MFPSSPTTMAVHHHDHLEHRRAEPRQFVVLWTIFLLFASVLSLGSTGFLGILHADIYRPAARTLLAIAGAGIAVLWPMVRLSQEAPSRPRVAFAFDAAVVVLPALAVVFAQTLPWMAGWSVEVGAVISLVFIAWAVLVAGALAWYFTRLQEAAPRWAWMLVVLGAACLGPAAAMLTPESGPGISAPHAPEPANIALMVSPITAPFEAARDRSWAGRPARVGPEHWGAALGLLAPAIAVWFLSRDRRRPLAFRP